MTRLKSLWIGLTDLRKIVRERRTLGLIIVLPIIVVIVVATTFSLGYQEFESKELAVGILGTTNSTYVGVLLKAIEEQNITAITYDTSEEAREDLMREKIDTVIEVDPWIAEKMAGLKRSWIAVYADETRPLLTAAIEVTLLQAKQEAVDELVWEYVSTMKEGLMPRMNESLGAIQVMLDEGILDPRLDDALAALGAIALVEDETVGVMASVLDDEMERMIVNGTPQQKFVISMVNRSTIVGSIRSLAGAKPILDSAYHMLRYVHPILADPGTIPREMLGDLSDLTGNISQITEEQAALILTALPFVRPALVDTLAKENPAWDPVRVSDEADLLLNGTREFIGSVVERREELLNMSTRLEELRTTLVETGVKDLVEEGRDLVTLVSGMEEGFITSPIYLAERPLYFGPEQMRYVDYISPGIFAFGILFSVLVYTVLSVVRDREKGILRRIFLCNVNRWSYVGGKCATCLAIAAVQVLILTACAELIFDVYIANLAKTLILGLYSSIGFVGLGLLISSVTKTELEAVTASMGLVFVMLMISGIFYPFELSPSIVRQASAYVPVTYVADLLKAGIIRNASLVEMAPDLLLVTLYGGGTLVIGTLAFRWRKTG